MLCMVENWFDKGAYEACCSQAARLREALCLVPQHVGYTARIMAAHDSLITALWRSSLQASSQVAHAVRSKRDHLAGLVGELRSIHIAAA